MKVVITGSGGQLGTELCRNPQEFTVPLDLPRFDLTDSDHLLDCLAEIRPQAVINTAAYTQVDKAEDDAELCRAVNADGVARLAEACRQLDATLVQISTDYVFGGDTDRRTPYQETDEPCPRGVYAQTKLEAERHAARWKKHFIVRTCGLYGQPGARSGGNFVATMLKRGLSRFSRSENGTVPFRNREVILQPPLRVVDDQHCTPSYVPHVARAIWFLLTTEAYGTYHVVNSGETTWFGMASEIFRQSGLDVKLEPISTAEYGARAPRPAYSVLDTSKYHALPGQPAMPTWQEALAEYLQPLGCQD